MHWSLSEFLNLLHARGQCWGLIELGLRSGIRIRAAGTVLFHHVLDGEITLTVDRQGPMRLKAGESAFVIADSVHALRVGAGASLQPVPFLESDAYGDNLHHVVMGGAGMVRLLSGRIKVRWPGGIAARDLPAVLRLTADDPMVRLDTLVARGGGEGAAALFTRAAALLLADAVREDPQCRRLFEDSSFRDPVAHAIQLMEIHMHRPWTIGALAQKVGLGRSSFAERFHAAHGKPPIALLTEMRMARAAMMLQHTPLRISEIAERVGYQSQTAFCRRFSAHFGTTPLHVRNAAGESPSGLPLP